MRSLLTEEERNPKKKEPRICRCFAPPPGTSFVKNGLYRWDYGIDCLCVYDEDGKPWFEGEIMFAARFQIISGKLY